MNDDELYDEVARELQAKKVVAGVWTRAFAEAEGQTERARALYIKYRVVQMAKTRDQQADAHRRIVASAAKSRAKAGFQRFAYTLAMSFCALLTLGCCLNLILVPLDNHLPHPAFGVVLNLVLASLFGFATRKCWKAYDSI